MFEAARGSCWRVHLLTSRLKLVQVINIVTRGAKNGKGAFFPGAICMRSRPQGMLRTEYSHRS